MLKEYIINILMEQNHIKDERMTGIGSFLSNLDEKYSIDKEVLENTPRRFVKAFDGMTRGYALNVDSIINSALFEVPEEYSELIVVDKINFNALCQHHLLPFSGQASIGYLPNKHILGLSKFARVVEAYSCRLTLQERLTQEIAMSLQKNLQPKGVIVYIESTHSCMCIRGVKSKDAMTKTLFTTGVFKGNSTDKAEYLKMIQK